MRPVWYFKKRGVVALFSTRDYGNMKPGGAKAEENRQLFAAEHLHPHSKVILADVIHGGKVVQVTPRSEEVIKGADALVTEDQGVYIAVTFADCPPLLLADAEARIVGIAHCGYRSTLAEIAANTLATMEGLGAQRNRIMAYLGPGICGRCYEFDGGEAKKLFSNWPGAIAPKFRGKGKWLVNLPLIIEQQLLSEGLVVKNLQFFRECTFENEGYFSARRDRVSPIEAGIAMIGLR